MIYRQILAIALCGFALCSAQSASNDPACDGIRPTSRQQFCCAGIIYYDPNFLYTCCDGRVCPVDNANAAVVPPRSQPTTTTTQRPAAGGLLPVLVQPRPLPQSQPSFWNPIVNPFANWGSGDNLIIVPRTQTTTQAPAAAAAAYCDGVDLTQLQRVQPSLACCGNTVVYDSRYYSCGTSSQVTTNAPISWTTAPTPVNLPTAFTPIVCDQNMYYIDPRISNSYKCCAGNAYDSRVETCQQAYRLTYQPTDSFRVQPLDPSNPPQRSVLTCGATKYIFASNEAASRYSC